MRRLGLALAFAGGGLRFRPSPGGARRALCPGASVSLGGRRRRAEQRLAGPSAGCDQPRGKRPARSGHRRGAPVAVVRERRGTGAVLRYQGRGGGRRPCHAGQRGQVDRYRLRADQSDAPSGRVPQPGSSLRSAGERCLRSEIPQGTVRAHRRLEQGGGHVSLGDTRFGGRVPGKGAGGLAGGEAWRRPGGSHPAGAGLERHDRHPPARIHASHAATGDGSRITHDRAVRPRHRCPSAARLSVSPTRQRRTGPAASVRARIPRGSRRSARRLPAPGPTPAVRRRTGPAARRAKPGRSACPPSSDAMPHGARTRRHR